VSVGYNTVTESQYRYSQSGWFGTAILGSKVLDEYKISSVDRTNDPLSQGEYLTLSSQTAHYEPLGSASYNLGNPTRLPAPSRAGVSRPRRLPKP
jgi:hypothetical protein